MKVTYEDIVEWGPLLEVDEPHNLMIAAPDKDIEKNKNISHEPVVQILCRQQPLRPFSSAPCEPPSAAAELPPAPQGQHRPPLPGADSACTHTDTLEYTDTLKMFDTKAFPKAAWRDGWHHLQDNKGVVFVEGGRAGWGLPPLLSERRGLLVSSHPLQLLLNAHPRSANLSLPKSHLICCTPGTILCKTFFH